MLAQYRQMAEDVQVSRRILAGLRIISASRIAIWRSTS
jgi:hypothetical protein